MAKNLIEVVMPCIVKSRNGVPTVIEWNGNRYVLDHPRHFKPEKKKPIKSAEQSIKDRLKIASPLEAKRDSDGRDLYENKGVANFRIKNN